MTNVKKCLFKNCYGYHHVALSITREITRRNYFTVEPVLINNNYKTRISSCRSLCRGDGTSGASCCRSVTTLAPHLLSLSLCRCLTSQTTALL